MAESSCGIVYGIQIVDIFASYSPLKVVDYLLGTGGLAGAGMAADDD